VGAVTSHRVGAWLRVPRFSHRGDCRKVFERICQKDSQKRWSFTRTEGQDRDRKGTKGGRREDNRAERRKFVAGGYT
jgi:hypothetical protein